MTQAGSSEVLCEGEAATDRLAAALAETLPARLVVGLHGTLGAGKTHFVRGFVAALGGKREDVVSPTFVLCQHYQCGKRTVNHLDAYRIKDDDEFLELGVDELFDSEAITFVEWADRVPDCLPPDRLDVELAAEGADTRRIVLTAQGVRADNVSRCIAAALGRYGLGLENK